MYAALKMTDEEIIYLFVTSKGKIDKNKTRLSWLEKHTEIANYLKTRFTDSESIVETIYRIKFNIDERPVCKQCGGHVKFEGFQTGFKDFCSSKCGNLSKEIQRKKRENSLTKYGTLHPSQSEVVKEKMRQTDIEKYGVLSHIQLVDQSEIDHNVQKQKQTKSERYGDCSFNNRDKAKQTCLTKYGEIHHMKNEKVKEKAKRSNQERYGQDWPMSNKGISQKAEQTMIEIYGGIGTGSQVIKEKTEKTLSDKYGVKNAFESKSIKEKISHTMIGKYGVDNYWKSEECNKKSHSEEANAKRNNTKKINHTFNSSKIEQQFKSYLENRFPEGFEYQFKTNKYPFNCDFYIKSFDLYVEIQGFWMHGGHPYDESSESDKDKANKMEIKKSKSYDKALEVWTHRDVIKRKYAQINNLRYLEIFSDKIDEAISIFEKFIDNLLK